MNIITLNAEHAESYRTLRLEALKKNPEAFGSSYKEEKENSVEFYKNRLQSDGSITLGAFEGDHLIGIVTLVLEQKLKLKHRATIAAMYVSTDKRGRGVGKSLMETAIRKAKDLKEVEQIYLTVVSNNESAKRLYSSLGFEVFGLDKRGLKVDGQYFDEDHMVLFL